MIRILYFASLRERLGTGAEGIEPDDGTTTVAGIAARLRGRGGVWSEALGAEATVLAAVNQEMARPDTQVEDGDEVAFFPPVTGG
jgi:molybdopterin synthase sulfur carrier subunit